MHFNCGLRRSSCRAATMDTVRRPQAVNITRRNTPDEEAHECYAWPVPPDGRRRCFRQRAGRTEEGKEKGQEKGRRQEGNPLVPFSDLRSFYRALVRPFGMRQARLAFSGLFLPCGSGARHIPACRSDGFPENPCRAGNYISSG